MGPGPRRHLEVGGGRGRGPRKRGAAGEGEAQEIGADARVDHRPQGLGRIFSFLPPGATKRTLVGIDQRLRILVGYASTAAEVNAG